MNTLVITSSKQSSLSSSTQPLIRGAMALGNTFDILIVGKQDVDTVISCASTAGCQQAFLLEYANIETIVQAILELGRYDNIIVAHDSMGKALLPRLAAKLNVMPVSGVTHIHGKRHFQRNMHAGSIIAHVHNTAPMQLLSLEVNCFEPYKEQQALAPMHMLSPPRNVVSSCYEYSEYNTHQRPDFSKAKVIVCGGRSLGSKENFAMLAEFADLFGGAVGGTRAAVEAGYIGSELQIGQTGRVISPELYFAVGVSGAVQHLAGIRGCKTIVAINSDANAPIFKVAKYGIVGDLFVIVPELVKLLSPR